MTSSLPSPIPSLLRLMAKSVLCVGPCTLDVSGPGRPRFGALQALCAVEPKLLQAEVGLWEDRRAEMDSC